MQKTAIILLFLCCMLSIYAQEVKIGIEAKDTIQKMEISDGLNLEIPKIQWDQQIKDDPFKSIKYEGSNQMNTWSVDDAFYYSLYGSLNIAPGLYTSQTAGVAIGVQIDRSFLVNYGAYGMKYDHNFGHRPYYDAIFHIDASYKASPWLIVGAYGQYAAFSRYNASHGSILHSPMIPYSGYGVHATTMFSEIFGLQSTVGREYNPINQKWQPVYGISPVINLNKFFK